ncbi:MAG: YIP1 family protein [Candidatus Heimdallarchaeota archaeon]
MLQILDPFKAGQEFRKLKSEEKWVLALAIVLIAGWLIAAGDGIILYKSRDLRNQYLEEELGVLTKENLETQIIFLVMFVPVSWVLKSVVFHVLSRILGGEEVKLSSTIHIIAYTHLPCIFKGLLDLFLGLMYQPPSYEEFVYQLQNPNFLLIFVKEYNIFFWAFTLMVIAVREQYNLSSKRAFFVVFILYMGIWITQIVMISSGRLFRGGI